MLRIEYRISAGGSHLQAFRSLVDATDYAEGVVKHSHPNIGKVQLWKYSIDECGSRQEFVKCFGIPTGQNV